MPSGSAVRSNAARGTGAAWMIGHQLEAGALPRMVPLARLAAAGATSGGVAQAAAAALQRRYPRAGLGGDGMRLVLCVYMYASNRLTTISH